MVMASPSLSICRGRMRPLDGSETQLYMVKFLLPATTVGVAALVVVVVVLLLVLRVVLEVVVGRAAFR